MEQLLPPGVANIRDLPYRWFEAIRMATVFIGFDELEKEERPPRQIWLSPEKLTAWFKQVEKDRKQRYSGKGEPGPIEDPVENPAAKRLITGD